MSRRHRAGSARHRAPPSPTPCAGASPASAIARKVGSTDRSSDSSRSKAMTSAPRRYASNACRPAPQPTSMTLLTARCPAGRNRLSALRLRPGGGPARDRPLVDPHGLSGHGFPAEHVDCALSARLAQSCGAFPASRVARRAHGSALRRRRPAPARRRRRRSRGLRAARPPGWRRSGYRWPWLPPRAAKTLRRATECRRPRPMRTRRPARRRKPAGDVDDVGDAQFGDEFVGGTVGFHLGDEPQFEISVHADSGDRVKQGARRPSAGCRRWRSR